MFSFAENNHRKRLWHKCPLRPFRREKVGSNCLAEIRRASVVCPNGKKIDVALGKHQTSDGLHHMVVADPRTWQKCFWTWEDSRGPSMRVTFPPPLAKIGQNKD